MIPILGKKSYKKWWVNRLLRIIFSRFGIALALVLLQGGLLFLIWKVFADSWVNTIGAIYLFTVVFSIVIVNNRMDPSAKIMWQMVITFFPVIGGLLYAYIQSDVGHRLLKKKSIETIQRSKNLLPPDEAAYTKVAQNDSHLLGLVNYLYKHEEFPVFHQTKSTYFPLGEDVFQSLKEEIRKAKQFVFLEFFIIEEGYMWNEILQILAQKVQEGVEVRVLYDGMCDFTKLPSNFIEKTESLGISCRAFSPIRPFISTHYNYRDHRKIVVIDGQVAYTGGINLADEYINYTSPFGHWKDTAIKLEGPAVRSMLLMFLQQWNIGEEAPDFQSYMAVEPVQYPKAKGFVIPYGDNPMDHDKVGELVYMDILNHATQYVHIMSPYLILDGELQQSLTHAAQRGVEVQLILPGIPDKKIPYALAKTHYRALLKAGVQIFEYTPGFVHAKVFVSDDRTATVGTINLDYRSLYHHFECGVYLSQTDSIEAIEADFQETRSHCHRVTLEEVSQRSWWMKIQGQLAKLVAPLL